MNQDTSLAYELLWDEVTRREPRLRVLEQEAWTVRGDEGESFCANEVWYERFKPRLECMVGWLADTNDPIMRSSAAYDVAYEHLYNQLPNCRDCWCM